MSEKSHEELNSLGIHQDGRSTSLRGNFGKGPRSLNTEQSLGCLVHPIQQLLEERGRKGGKRESCKARILGVTQDFLLAKLPEGGGSTPPGLRSTHFPITTESEEVTGKETRIISEALDNVQCKAGNRRIREFVGLKLNSRSVSCIIYIHLRNTLCK